MTTEQGAHALPYLVPADGDAEMAALIDAWRYRGPAIGWDAVVGHAAQIERCLELVEKLHRSQEELAQLRLRTGAGLLICGPSGVGKTLLARALASALGREVIAPPTAELTPESIRRLYAELTRTEQAVVVLLDEAESIIAGPWQLHADESKRGAFLAALDGIQRPQRGPITVALTTDRLEQLDEAAIRPGRLAPRLLLEPPTAEERLVLLRRLADGLPVQGSLDLEQVVERTQGWTGAELAGAIEEACSRSLRDHSDALRQDLLLQVVAERYVIVDEGDEDTRADLERVALHEAGHALYAWLRWPGGLASVRIGPRDGSTELLPSVLSRFPDAQQLRHLAELALAGPAAELIAYGEHRVSNGGHRDKAHATELLIGVLEIEKPYAVDVLERGSDSDRGSERMRAGWHAELEARAMDAQASVIRLLAPHAKALRPLAEQLLEAPEGALSGEALEAAIDRALPGSLAALDGEPRPTH
jgi:ATP-dependent Zn protease